MGFRGNPYRFVAGDYKEIAAEAKEALARPIPLLSDHDIAPRVIPSVHRTLAEYGPKSFLWFGPKPGAIVADPEMIREILSKTSSFHKMSVPYGEMLAKGLAAAEDEDWARLRALINPAFHLDKLKAN
ncbi:hypothetical protein M569_14911 [Genlisea aurea]|uniref:Cytochrome P450 n=1 Tax=Genlisea aurea TaxID=192259 RepID=S8DK99_9LAMI|nr:hypothetical protein M569_14911 [Genlisea aurea]